MNPWSLLKDYSEFIRIEKGLAEHSRDAYLSDLNRYQDWMRQFHAVQNPIQIQTCLFHTTLAELKRIY